MAELAVGKVQLAIRARRSLAEGDAQWSAQLCDHLLALDPQAKEFKLLRAEALAEKLVTATGRNYYLTVAQEMREDAAK